MKIRARGREEERARWKRKEGKRERKNRERIVEKCIKREREIVCVCINRSSRREGDRNSNHNLHTHACVLVCRGGERKREMERDGGRGTWRERALGRG